MWRNLKERHPSVSILENDFYTPIQTHYMGVKSLPRLVLIFERITDGCRSIKSIAGTKM